jgi:putative CocE/NonD family hydrolase
MRDGVILNAAAYTPRRAGSGIPTVLELTPYGVDGLHDNGLHFVSHGLAYLGVDVRGRGDSGGDFVPTLDDQVDGVDLISWITAQPWSDGRVVLYGWSYTGASCWLILGTGHPAVQAASIAAPFSAAVDLPRNGVPDFVLARWRAGLVGRGTSYASNSDDGLWAQEIADVLASDLPIWTAAEAFGVPFDEHLVRHLESPDPGPAWSGHECRDDEVAAIAVPVLAIGGTHDDCSHGTFHHWSRFERLAPGAASPSSHLLVGPWDHVGSQTGSGSVGDLHFGPAARVDVRQLRTDWFRHVLFDDPEPQLLTDRFVYYVTGAEEWRVAESVDAATSGDRELYLRSMPGPNDAFHSGWLDDTPADGPEYALNLDPRDARVLELELTPRPRVTPEGASLAYDDLMMAQAGNDPTNQIFTLTVEGDGVVYHSRPLEEACPIVGRPSLTLRVVPDAADADLLVLLHVILPSGEALFLSSALLRLSRREGNGTVRPLVPGVEQELDVTTFRFCARVLPEGARLRLTVRSAWSTFSLPSADGRRDHPAVHLRLVHRRDAPSALTLPVGA